jgi:branched-chain amino acid transport system ATP-binding protein
MAITSPTDFMDVVRRWSVPGNFSNAHRGTFTTISRTFQVVQPYEGMTALESVVVAALFGTGDGRRPLTAARDDAEAVLDSVGLAEKAPLPSERLNVPERKRLELARALVMQPRLILLDEIMAGLSVAEMEDLMTTIGGVRDSGVTILVIEHVMPVISRLADRLVVLHHGRKVVEGSPEEVFADRRVIQAYLGTRATRRRGRGEPGPEERP